MLTAVSAQGRRRRLNDPRRNPSNKSTGFRILEIAAALKGLAMTWRAAAEGRDEETNNGILGV
jgi:hypothetical protein